MKHVTSELLSESGVKFARKVKVKNVKGEFLATHRNPKNGEIYVEDIPLKSGFQGRWIPMERITFI